MKTIPASVLIIAETILVLHSAYSWVIEINDIIPNEEGEYDQEHNNKKQVNDNKAVNFGIGITSLGTKWCGPGNTATLYDDLGTFNETDSCCREHDYCDDHISGWETKHGLVNTGVFTRSHCKCDRKFRECLKKVDDPISAIIGFKYFTLWGPKCFKQDYPIITCSERVRGRCVNYILDERREKMYQWFDNPKF